MDEGDLDGSASDLAEVKIWRVFSVSGSWGAVLVSHVPGT